MTLSEIRNQKREAEGLFADALQDVCTLAKQAPDSLPVIATMDGYRREVEALSKIEMELIASGRMPAA